MNILIIDDHQLFIDGLGYVLNKLADEIFITEANSVEEAISTLDADASYDLILLDINMPSMDGLAFMQHFSAVELCVPIVVISSEQKAGLIRQALDWGAMGFIPKSHNGEQMLEALEEVLQGSIYVPTEVQRQLDRLPVVDQQDIAEQLQQVGISKKQYQTLELVAKGLSNQQIATTLNRSEHTVKSHISALFQILGATNRTECVNLAKQYLLIAEHDSQ